MSDWNTGDRVIVNPKYAKRFTQPIRGWIEKSKAATVLWEWERQGGLSGQVMILFDCRTDPRWLQDYRQNMPGKWLVPSDIKPPKWHAEVLEREGKKRVKA